MTRIREDYLRVLRLFRFHAWYGRGEMDDDALRAAAEAKAGLKQLSGERIAKELLRLLECPNPGPVLRLMAAAGILAVLLPAALQLPRLEHLTQVEAENIFGPDALLRLAALLPPDRDAARRTGAALKLSNAQRARLEELAAPEGEITAQLSAKDVRRMLYRIGPARLSDRALLQWAGAPPQANVLQWRMLLKMAEDWERPHFPLTGQAVIEAGVPEGPEVGRILAEIEAWWVDDDFTADAPQLAEKLKAVTA
jgi:poly(A) polymerase